MIDNYLVTDKRHHASKFAEIARKEADAAQRFRAPRLDVTFEPSERMRDRLSRAGIAAQQLTVSAMFGRSGDACTLDGLKLVAGRGYAHDRTIARWVVDPNDGAVSWRPRKISYPRTDTARALDDAAAVADYEVGLALASLTQNEGGGDGR